MPNVTLMRKLYNLQLFWIMFNTIVIAFNDGLPV